MAVIALQEGEERRTRLDAGDREAIETGKALSQAPAQPDYWDLSERASPWPALPIMGRHYPSGGINLSPAMTFGFIVGKHAAILDSR